MSRILIFIVVMLFAFPLVASEGFSTLEEQMTGKEFTGAGLEKLTQEELDALNDWIRRHSVATLDAPKAAAAADEAVLASRRMSCRRGWSSSSAAWPPSPIARSASARRQ